ncbi:MAG: LacI family DNA-binding transcriptional regulator [Treponema sp.]|nr:LacI family DNA-binding transcriptional regulator [Treponema sp.]
MEEDKKTVTQYDVAKAAGVTRSMVSYVISGNTERSVAPETRRKILEAIETLGYRPNKAAQALQQGDVALAFRRIGIIIHAPDVFRRPYYAEIIEGIYTFAHKNNFEIAFIRFFYEFENPVLFNKLIHEEEIGSLILIALEKDVQNSGDKLILKMKERIKKIVCVEWKFSGLSSVYFDRKAAGKKDTEYLIACGYYDISYIGERDERIDGVKEALAEHSLQNGSASDIVVGAAFDINSGYAAIKKLHEQNRLSRAIVCGSDEVAMGVLCYLNEFDIAVPKRVAVISIDNIDMSGYTSPPLTTLNIQKTEMGAMAVELIVSDRAGQDEHAVEMTLPTVIVERKSCCN